MVEVADDRGEELGWQWVSSTEDIEGPNGATA